MSCSYSHPAALFGHARYVQNKTFSHKHHSPNAAKKHICDGWARGCDLANVKLYMRLGLEMSTKLAVYMKRMGIAAFMFFSLKGLAWLAFFYFGWQVIS